MPPAPEQLKVSIRVPAVVGLIVTDPESATVPLKAGSPLAMHIVAFELVQLTVTDCPVRTALGVAVRLTVGTTFGFTVTVVTCVALADPSSAAICSWNLSAVAAVTDGAVNCATPGTDATAESATVGPDSWVHR